MSISGGWINNAKVKAVKTAQSVSMMARSGDIFVTSHLEYTLQKLSLANAEESRINEAKLKLAKTSKPFWRPSFSSGAQVVHKTSKYWSSTGTLLLSSSGQSKVHVSPARDKTVWRRSTTDQIGDVGKVLCKSLEVLYEDGSSWATLRETNWFNARHFMN